MDKFSQGPFAPPSPEGPPGEGPRPENSSQDGLPRTTQLPIANHLPKTDAPPAHPETAVLSLKQAMRRARFDDAERSSVITDLRAARIGRLEVLKEALAPLIVQIPDDADLFDIGIMPGGNPRLFIDMIGFVEMAHDHRTYRFLQDTRNSRMTLAESASIEAIVEAITLYVARRLLERDKALAADTASGTGYGAMTPSHPPVLATAQAKAPAKRVSALDILGSAFAFVINVLGSMTFFGLLAFAAWIAWSNFSH